jgi:hypothetical protein
MQVRRKPLLVEAIQYQPGVVHPFITVDDEGRATANDHSMSSMREITPVNVGDWVVREIGNELDQVYTDSDFQMLFATQPTYLSNLFSGVAQIQQMFEEADPTTASGCGGPLAIMVSGWTHNGKTMISSAIESMLVGFGFENVAVHASEESPEVRAGMLGRIIEMKDQPDTQAFFCKPITIYEVSAGSPRRAPNLDFNRTITGDPNRKPTQGEIRSHILNDDVKYTYPDTLFNPTE